MSQTATPKYRVEFAANGGTYTSQAWPQKYLGRPSQTALFQWITDFEASTAPGGCNAHLGATHVTEARIIRQSDRKTIAMFEE